VRGLFYALVTLGVAALLAWIWPERSLLCVSSTLFAALLFGLWGAMNLNSGVWCPVTRGATSAGEVVALTYDDGPDPDSTPLLLELLAERGARATFFCVGEKVRAHPELVRRIAQAGHELGNHCDSHSVWTNFYFAGRLENEVARCQASLREAAGVEAQFFRPPFGHANHATAGVVRRQGLEVVGWQVRGLDLPGSVPEKVAARVIDGLTAGGIALLHDGDREPQLVLDVTRAVLDGLAARGLRSVTVSELR
jgi:peptidoglycan/xylan/chitin deacetylase (PgdA/CDA1 family)